MTQKYIPIKRDQQYLFPPSIQAWLPEKHLARFVVEIISPFDLRPLTETYTGKGCNVYHPEIMLTLLFYGYASGVFSSRKIEKKTYDSVAFRFIIADNHPDHDSIANFRKRFLEQLEPIFVQILMYAREIFTPAPLPEDAESIDKMRNKLKSVEVRKVYVQRKSTVESVFGIIKHVLGVRQFFLRSKEAVTGEWTLVPTA